MKAVSGIDLERMLPYDKVSVEEIDGVMSKSMNEEVELDEAEKGLWHNIHQKRKRGEKMRKKGDPGAHTDAAIKRSQ